MVFDLVKFFPAGDIPNTEEAIGSAGCDLFPVGTEGGSEHDVLDLEQFLEGLQRGDVPDNDFTHLSRDATGMDEEFAVGAVGERVHPFALGRQPI